MQLQNFLQSEWWKPQRLVGKLTRSGEIKTRDDEDKKAENKDSETGLRADATPLPRSVTPPEPEAAPVVEVAAAAPPPETPPAEKKADEAAKDAKAEAAKAVSEALAALEKSTLKELKAFLGRYKEAYSKLDTSSKENLYAGLGEMLKDVADDKTFFANIGRAYSGITQTHKDAFKKKYKKTDADALNINIIQQAIADETIPVQDLLVALSLAAETGTLENLTAAKAWVDLAKDFEEDNRKLDEVRENFKKIDGILRKNGIQAKLDAFINAKSEKKDENKTELLDAIDKDKNNTDRKLIENALDSTKITPYEQRIVEEELKKTHLTPKEINEKEDFNFRKRMIALTLIEEKDVANWLITKPPKVTPEEARDMRELIRLRAPKAENEKSPIPDDLKGLGLAGLLEKLIEQLTELFEKISQKLDDTFKKKKSPEVKKPKFAASPFETDKKIAVKDKYETGKGITFEAEQDTKIFAVEKGKLTIDATTSTVTIEKPNKSKIIYQGITPKAGLATDAEINAGDEIGVINDTRKLTLQVKDAKGTELDPTDLLAPYTAPATAAAAAPAAAAAAPATSTASPAGSKLVPARADAEASGPPAPTEAEQQAAEQLEQNYKNALIAAFRNHFGNTINFTTPFPFDLPYKNGDQINTVPCQIQGNIITMNGTKYKMEFPNSADLQTLEVNGATTMTDNWRKLWASKLKFSNNSEIVLPKFILALEGLRKNTSGEFTWPLQKKGESITFTKQP